MSAVRGAVFIGVSQAGRLPRLEAAIAGVAKMREWATVDQGFDESSVKVITDATGPVTVRNIKTAVSELLTNTGLEQILIYFAGHGVNLGGAEYWLLSGAPADSDEAVNLDGSVSLARMSGVPHVVFISDACRTAADGVQMGF